MSQIHLPSTTSQVLTIFRFEMLKSLRGKRFVGSLAITIGISLFLILSPEIFGTELPNTPSQYLINQLGFLFYLLVIIAVLFGSSSIVSEFHERTCYSFFVNPITRTSIWIGKFLAAQTNAIIMISIFYGMGSVVVFAEYETIPIQLVESFGFAILTLTMLMCFSFLISSVQGGPTSAAVLIFFLFILFLPLMDQLLITVAEVKPWFSPTFSKGVIENVLFDPYPIDVITGEPPRGPFDTQRFVSYPDESAGVMITYSVAFSIASVFIFKRKEVLG